MAHLITLDPNSIDLAKLLTANLTGLAIEAIGRNCETCANVNRRADGQITLAFLPTPVNNKTTCTICYVVDISFELVIFFENK